MLDNALKDFLGVGQDKFPKENATLVLSKYGDSMCRDIQVIVTAFEAELVRTSDVAIADAIKIARIEISKKFPELGVPGLDALDWAFSYWFK